MDSPENAGDRLIPFPSGSRPSARHSGARDAVMSAFLGPLDATGRVPPRQQTRVAAFLMSCHGAMARQLAIALALQTESRLANRIECAALPRNRNRLAVAPGDVVGARSGIAVSASIVGSGLAAKAGRRRRRSRAGVDHRHRSARPCPACGHTAGGVAAGGGASAGSVRAGLAEDRVRKQPPDAGANHVPEERGPAAASRRREHGPRKPPRAGAQAMGRMLPR